jgi:hypothetical protein
VIGVSGGSPDATCDALPPPLNALQPLSEARMTGIAMILVFVVVLAVLNRVEFGRFD